MFIRLREHLKAARGRDSRSLRREPVCAGGPSFTRAVPPMGRLHPARVLHHVEGVVQGHGGLSRRVDTFPREIGKQRFSSSRVGWSPSH